MRKRILIIDDDARNTFALSAVLRAKGFDCINAASAAEGMQLLEGSEKTDMILMDMMMPEMDGYQAIAVIKGTSGLPTIPIVAVTAQAMTGDREKVMAAGADGYVSKPVDVDVLLTLMNDLFK